MFNSTVSVITDEDRAAKQSEVNLLMDEVEQAQTRLLSLEREKVIQNFMLMQKIFSILNLFGHLPDNIVITHNSPLWFNFRDDPF